MNAEPYSHSCSSIVNRLLCLRIAQVIKFILLSLFPTNLNPTLYLIVESYIYKINWRDFGYDSSMLATERCAFNSRLNAALSSSHLSSSSSSLRVSSLPPRERCSTIARREHPPRRPAPPPPRARRGFELEIYLMELKE